MIIIGSAIVCIIVLFCIVYAEIKKEETGFIIQTDYDGEMSVIEWISQELLGFIELSFVFLFTLVVTIKNTELGLSDLLPFKTTIPTILMPASWFLLHLLFDYLGDKSHKSDDKKSFEIEFYLLISIVFSICLILFIEDDSNSKWMLIDQTLAIGVSILFSQLLNLWKKMKDEGASIRDRLKYLRKLLGEHCKNSIARTILMLIIVIFAVFWREKANELLSKTIGPIICGAAIGELIFIPVFICSGLKKKIEQKHKKKTNL